MKGFLAVAALAGAALATPLPQASGSACSPDRAGQFTITVVNVTRSAKRDLEARQLDGILRLTLQGGILKDQAGRTGYIASNRQFQFDNPIQAGAVVTSGWSSCGNNSLALGGSAIFYQCLSGTFYNLYDQSQGGQCNAIYIVAQSGSASTSVAASVLSDGQPQATTAVTQLSDGQPQATSIPAPPVTVLSDGQPQATSVQGPPVTVLSDGQPQATSVQGPPVTVLSDGQPQATSVQGPPVTVLSDGQPQATTVQGPPVTVLSDGQPQATTVQGPAVTVLSDGQPQAPKVTQISDGQIQAPTSTAAIATFTGAANRNAGGLAFVAGIVGAVALL